MEDTIAAIATPSGQGAVALLRMSGHKAIDVADKIFWLCVGPFLGQLLFLLCN